MSWKLAFLFCILLVAEVPGQSLDDAVILTPPGQVLHSQVDGIPYLSCRVANLPSDAKVNWIFAKHSLTIFHGDSLQVDDSRYTYRHPPHSNVYDLQIFPARASDQGVYKCEIDGTNKAVTMELVLEGAPQLPQVDTTPLNHTGCCTSKGVSTSCLPACTPSSIPDSFDPASSCSAMDVIHLVECGSDGRNHENCCARRNIPAVCLSLCSNHPEKMTGLGDAEMVCLNHTSDIISCYELGAVTLPGPPREVSVLSTSDGGGQYGLLVSWKPPFTNLAYVSGYIISYKKTLLDQKFRSSAIQSSTTTQFRIKDLQVNTGYSVYVTAVGQHGSSQPSYRVDTVLQDTSSTGQAVDVLECCMKRQVSPECQTLLCHTKVWVTFNTTNMLRCYHFLPDVFSCLAGERDHTPCCAGNNVPEMCQPMCSGHPPAFNRSLAQCIPKLTTIEACVQAGLDSLPTPPVQLTLNQVSAHEAVVSWTPSNHSGETAIKAYIVMLRRGNENAQWSIVGKVEVPYQGGQPFIQLTNLTETEHYAIRVISQNERDSSLPSETLRFTTYPEVVSATDRPVIQHNMTKCCYDSGMPAVCAEGCRYLSNITDYYGAHLLTCFSHIGQVLACGSDGRDHRPCCEREGVKDTCLPLCAHITPGPLDERFYGCIDNTAIAVTCFKEGLEDLVRMPDNLTATDITTQHIQIEWLAPRTGPRPEKYIIFYRNVNFGMNNTFYDETEDKLYILQNLVPGMQYEIQVASFLNNSQSPFTGILTVFTPIKLTPSIPGTPTNTSAGLWTSREQCCRASTISDECKPVCLNQPAVNGADCSHEERNILVCASDGQNHSLCCQESGLPVECLPLCSGGNMGDFDVRKAGCQADANLGIITSCFLSNSGLVPSPPLSFDVDDSGGSFLKFWWKDSAQNCAPPERCFYDLHYWPYNNNTYYRTIYNVSSPYIYEDVPRNVKFTYTVTARNSKGSSSAAPWRTVILPSAEPSVAIAQDPPNEIHDVGAYVRLVCDVVNFFEAPTFTWMLNKRVIGNSRDIRLGPITKDSEGDYMCIASSPNLRAASTSYLNVRFEPLLTYFRTDTVSPNVGGQAVLACWFRGHPFTNNTLTAWTKDGRQMNIRSSKYSSTATTRLHTGITAFRLKIADIVPNDYGEYKCNVSNQYGIATGSTHLLNPDTMPPEVTASPSEKQNITGCCSRHNVPEPCMRICRFEVDVTEVVSNPAEYFVCLSFFRELVMCAADGADHSECCRSEGVLPYCWPFCAGKVPDTDSVYSDINLLQCTTEVPTIFTCLAKGYDRIPTAPTMVRATLEADTIRVTWGLPSRNADRAEYYRIFFNSTANPVPMAHLVTKYVQSYVIENILQNHIYNVWMVAGNDFGQSHPSSKVTVSVHGILPMPPTSVRATVFDGTGVEVTWNPPSYHSSRVDGYAVFYKPVNSAEGYDQVRTRSTSIRIPHLEPLTEYVLHVKSVNVYGLGNVQSDDVHFETGVYTGGSDAYAGPHRPEEISSAQIAGIGLAVAAVIAIGVVVFLLISRSRVQQKKTNDTVSFENPGYGNQQVRIGGLPGETPYDNAVMQPPTHQEADGSFGYARLNEDHTAAAAETTKSVPEMEYPSAEYVYENAADVKPASNGTGTGPEVATLQVSDITMQEKNESTT